VGWLKKLGKAWEVVKASAPVLPIPDKAKNVIAKGGEIEQDVTDVIRQVKPTGPATQ